MNFRVAGLLGVCSVIAASCIVPEDANPRVAISADLATKFVHRGMTNVDKPVVQPRMAVELPTESGDRMHFVAGGTIELSNDTGDAWFPDGHAGRFTQIDLFADYEKQLGDVFTVRAGIFSYNFPNGLEFLNGERGSTTEVFTILSANVLERLHRVVAGVVDVRHRRERLGRPAGQRDRALSIRPAHAAQRRRARFVHGRQRVPELVPADRGAGRRPRSDLVRVRGALVVLTAGAEISGA
jgi:hypothetical protein